MTEQSTETATPGTLPETTASAGEGTARPLPLDPDMNHDGKQNPDPEKFPREYVAKLRDEAAKHRTRARRADDLAQRLHGALVAAAGRLAYPTDLAFDEAHLSDPDALTAAIDDLLTRKPHLASRRIVGDVGQGARRGDSSVDLAGMLRSNAS